MSPAGVELLAMELTIDCCKKQSFSMELSNPASVSVKCKQMETFNIYTLNSLTYVVRDCEVMLSR